MTSSDEPFGSYSRRSVLSATAGGVVGLAALGTTSGRSARAQEAGGRTAATITASPATSGTNATYTVTVQNIAARNGQSNVDQVVLDFGGTGMNFNTVQRTDVTAVRNPGTSTEARLVVTQTRTSLSGDRPTIGISRASGQPPVTEGDTLQLRIPGVTNPQVGGQHNVRIQLNELATGQRAGLLDSRTGSFTITGGTGTVNATVTSDGEPVTAETTFTDDRGHVLGTATPDETGSVTLEGVIPDTYDVTASPAGFEPTTATEVTVVKGETTEVEVQPDPEPTAFDVAVDLAARTVEVGDPIEANVEVTNQGDESGEGEVTTELLLADGDVVATQSESVELDAGKSTSVTTEFETDELEPAHYSVRVSTDDDVAARFVSVVSVPYDVEISDVTGQDNGTDTVDVTATVTNVAPTEEHQSVELTVDDEVIDRRPVNLASGETGDVTFSYGTAGVEPGEVQATASIPDTESEDTTVIDVPEEANMAVEIAEAPAEVVQGRPVTVTVEVTNTGGVQATRPVSVEIAGRIFDTRNVTVAPGQTQVVTLTGQASDVSTGTQTVTARTPDDTAAASVTVLTRRRS